MTRWIARMLCLVCAIACLGIMTGCVGRSTLREKDRPTSRPVGELGNGYFDERVEAFVVPPNGWKLDRPKIDGDRTHLTWLSPDGDTAYGIIYMRAPMIAALLPSGKFLHERALGAFMTQFAKDQGSATLIESHWDDDRNAMRFIAEGELYKIRPILSMRERNAWAVYAGTLTGKRELPDELRTAELAREATRVGLDAAGGADAAMKMLKRAMPGN